MKFDPNCHIDNLNPVLEKAQLPSSGNQKQLSKVLRPPVEQRMQKLAPESIASRCQEFSVVPKMVYR